MAGNVNKKPKVREHADSGLRYLTGKKKVLFETGAVMARAEFDKLSGNKGAITAGLAALSKDPEQTGFDWAYACTTGCLRRKKKQAAGISRAAPGGRKEPPRRVFVFSSAFLITVVMALVGIGSAVMSAYHTSAFLVYGGKPAWTAVLTGVMLILFSTTAFTAARHFFYEKSGLHYFLGALFVVAGFAVIAYSMFSTLTVNFEQFQWRSNEKAKEAVSESGALAAHRELVRQNEAALAEVSAEIARLENEAGHWRGASWKRYDDTQAALALALGRRNTLRERGAELAGRAPELAEAEAVSRDTVYRFAARLFGADEDVMRFFVYVIPACLYDILAPFALSTVLLLLDRRKKEGEA